MSLQQEILNLDFAALRTFRLVYLKKSFSAAADELGMNASSISYTIERVRKASGDPLFVRQSGGIVPTDQCRNIMQSVERILTEAERLSVADRFDPAKVETEITLFSTGYANQLVFPHVIRRLRKEAPGIRIEMLSGQGNPREALLSGRADIANTPVVTDDNGLHVVKNYLADVHVCMMDPSHPMASKKLLTVDEYVSMGHVRYEPVPAWLQAPIRYAVEKGLNPNRIISTNNPLELADLVLGTDLFAVLPSRLASLFGGKLKITPFDFPTPIHNNIYWAHATHRSPVKSWVRSLILEEADKLPRSEF